MTALVVRGLHVRHPGQPDWALRDINLHVPAGGHTVVLGSSGAGKTTLLRALLGAGRVEAGYVRHGDIDPFERRGRTSVRRRCGLILPGGELAPRLRARTAAVSGCTHLLGAAGWWSVLHGRTPADLADRLGALAAEQGVGQLLDRQVGQLSEGERQRLALIRALLGCPGVLLADEPTAGLDPVTAQQAVTALLAQPATLLVTTHDPAVAARFSRVLALRDGAVVHDGGALSTEQAGDLYARTPR